MPAKPGPVQRRTKLANDSAEVTLGPQCRASVIEALGPESGEAFLKAIAPRLSSVRSGWLVQLSQPNMDSLHEQLVTAAGHASELHSVLENLDDDAIASVHHALLQRVSDTQPATSPDTVLESSDANAEAAIAGSIVADMWASDLDELQQLAAVATRLTDLLHDARGLLHGDGVSKTGRYPNFALHRLIAFAASAFCEATGNPLSKTGGKPFADCVRALARDCFSEQEYVYHQKDLRPAITKVLAQRMT